VGPSEEVIEQMRETLEIARIAVLEKNYNRASAAMTELEKLTWLARLTIREQWKNDSPYS